MIKTLLKFGSIAAIVVAYSVMATSANAAFIIEPNGPTAGNYSAANGTSNSTVAGAGTLGAPGLTAGAASVFGGEPYTYTYTPGVDGDNASFSAGDSLNGFAGLVASGATAGGAGDYNVYLTYPQSANQSEQPSLYDIDVDGDSAADVSSSYDQNVNSTVTGLGIGLWELVGQITVTDPNQPITLTISPTGTPATFVGVRTAGVLFDAVVPEPSGVLSALSGLLLCLGLMRRR